MPINVDEEYDGLIRRVATTSPLRAFVAIIDDEIGQHPLDDEHRNPLAQSTRWPDYRRIFSEDDPSPGIRIGIPILRSVTRQKFIDIGFWNNARLGIISYGAGVEIDFPATLGIPFTTDFPATLGIPAPTIADPSAALAAHLGQGTLFVQWTHPTPELVNYYEVYGSAVDGGPYTKLQHGEFKITHGLLHNIPMAFTVYLQVRAVGLNGAISNFTPVRQGKFQLPSVRCSVRAISGSTIPAGALFVAKDEQTGRLIGFRAETDIVISC